MTSEEANPIAFVARELVAVLGPESVAVIAEGPEVAAAWFSVENHHFNGDPPALALSKGSPDVGVDVVLAAFAFIDV